MIAREVLGWGWILGARHELEFDCSRRPSLVDIPFEELCCVVLSTEHLYTNISSLDIYICYIIIFVYFLFLSIFAKNELKLRNIYSFLSWK